MKTPLFTQSIIDAFELREVQSAYNAIFYPENRDINPKWAMFYDLFYFILGGWSGPSPNPQKHFDLFASKCLLALAKAFL